MDRRVRKLKQLGVGAEAAEALVNAGLDTPRKIKAAKIGDLRKVKADKDRTVARWREKK